MPPLKQLNAELIECRACPRLVRWREEVAATKRRAYREWTYWGRPVPAFGDPRAPLLLLGLAPAAHGANRTGRMFTGDRSGDFLYAALHRAGLASQPTSERREDGLTLKGAYITAPVHCAPPDNLPLPEEIRACSSWLDREFALLRPKVILALGGIAWSAALELFSRRGLEIPRPRPAFGHGAVLSLPKAPHLVGVYHVSQQNTQTGRLTPPMFDAVLKQALKLSRESSR